MRFVEQLVGRPGRCVYYPQIGPSHREGFVVSNILLEDHYEQAVSVTALRDIAAKIPQANLVARDELTKALAENEALKHRLDQVELENRELNQELDAISVLKGRGYSPAKKPGRKPATATK